MKDEEKIFGAIAIIAGFVALTITIWAFAKYPVEQAQGERFVRDEILVLPIFGGIYFKPITMMMVTIFVCWVCGLEALRERSAGLPTTLRRLILISFSVVALVFGYEVIWNFLMWTAAHIINPSLPLDSLTQQLNPTIVEPKNFVFVTKRDTLICAVSLYSILFFRGDARKDVA